MEAVGLLQRVSDAVTVAVDRQRIGGHPTSQLASGRNVVDELPAVDLLLVGQAIAVGIRQAWLGVKHNFGTILDAVVVGVRPHRIGAELQLDVIRHSVAVRIPTIVIRVIAAVDDVAQAVAVRILLARKRQVAVLRPGERVTTVGAPRCIAGRRGRDEAVEGRREHVVAQHTSQRQERRGLVRNDGAHRIWKNGDRETLLCRYDLSFRQPDRQLAVHAGLHQYFARRDLCAALNLEARGASPFDTFPVSSAAQLEILVQVSLPVLELQFIDEMGSLQIVRVVLP